MTGSLLVVTLLGLQYYGYIGILEDAQHRKNQDALVGGASLDLLAIVFLAQFGGLFSVHVYWILIVLPIWGIYKMRSLFGGDGSTGPTSTPVNAPSEVDAAQTEDRRRKRAERRRQKRS